MQAPAPDSPIRAVVFDLDGLMINTEDVYQLVGTELMRRRGLTFDDDLRGAMMGQPTLAALSVMIDWHKLKDKVEDLAVESDRTFWEMVEGNLTTMPGLHELLALIDELGLRKAIATSGARKYAEELLSRVDLHEHFEFLLTSNDITHGKPNPEIYLKAAEKLGMQPCEILVLEDSQNGCRAGVDSGAYAVAVPSPHSAGHDFTGAKFVADTLADTRIRRVLAGEAV
ncbi:HAD family hydrolase [Aeoliella mucimassa]|uniref:Phosphorylated carbohydrates phosphatase n=1 Tax=Aeoliella mucimassa TaxID=2527972 RepID=A0A518AR51_9BACT|nr:HAD family phosphatase [Aeoliella mucimassa]QDU57194.1 Phosphorylated carbohydrates phosphatase [Aeoliella mucimassa]